MMLSSCVDYQSLAPTKADWSTPGTVIVSYGSILNPYDTSDVNSYFLYDENGQKIDVIEGDAAYSPAVLLLKECVGLNFYSDVQIVGSDMKTAHADNHSIVDYEFSRSGSSGMFIYNNSPAAYFKYDFLQILEDGQTNSGVLYGGVQGIAVSESETLVYLRDERPRHSTGEAEYRLEAISHDGSQTIVEFPEGHDPLVKYTPLSPLKYLSDGKYLLTDSVEVAPNTYHVEGRIFKLDKTSNPWKPIVLDTFTYQTTRDTKLFFAIRLSRGRVGIARKDGKIIVESFVERKKAITGDIKNELNSTTKVGRVFSQNDDYFYILNGKTLQIRTWDNPEENVRTIQLDDQGCAPQFPFGKSASCGIANVYFRDG